MSFQSESWVFWLIVIIGVFTYALIFDALLNRDNEKWEASVRAQLDFIEANLSILPLLGLLGTIIGLLQTFSDISNQHLDLSSLLAGGVGTALGTTQLGLLFAIPGLLLHNFLLRCANRAQQLVLAPTDALATEEMAIESAYRKNRCVQD